MSDHVLNNTRASGVYFLDVTQQSAIEPLANDARLTLLRAEIHKHSTLEDFLRQLGSELKFPAWFGANFDALFDCLTDREWQPAKGLVLLISGMSRLRTSAPVDFATLIRVLQDAAETRRAMHAPFWILIDAPARGIPAFPEA